MDYAALHREVTTDPAGLGYTGKDDVQVAALLNDLARRTVTRTRTRVYGSQILAALDSTELGGMTATELQRLLLVTSATDGVDPRDPNVRAIIGTLFPAAIRPASRANLLALQTETLVTSRAHELGLGVVAATDLAEARRLMAG